jgi:hypothetical protein
MANKDKNILYDDGSIQVIYAPIFNGHYIDIKGISGIALQEGVLEELARTDRTQIGRKLEACQPGIRIILKEIVKSDITMESLGLAISHARVAELEQQLDDAYSQNRG